MHIFDYENAPSTLLTPEITALVGAIREYKGKQELYLNARADVLNALMEVAKIQSTTSSNRIEGIATTDARMRELISKKAIPKNRNEREIAGYRDVLATIHESHEFIPINPNVLLQLHRDLYSKLPQGIGGHWKLNDNVIEETGADGKTFVRFRPASAVETPMAIETLCANYRRAVDEGRFDRLLLIPMFIFDFLCVHPFHDGNGRMSRLLTLLLLYRSCEIYTRHNSESIPRTRVAGGGNHQFSNEQVGQDSRSVQDDTREGLQARHPRQVPRYQHGDGRNDIKGNA